MAKKKSIRIVPPPPPIIVPPVIPGVPGTARISLNVSSFQPITSGQFCGLGVVDPMNPQNNVPPLTINSTGGSIRFKDNDPTANGIVVETGVFLQFTINSQTDNNYDFAGLCFVPLGNVDTDLNFTGARWTAARLFVHAKKITDGARWKLFVAIMDYSGGAPVLGLIDPDIENDSTQRSLDPSP
ncbi:MAG: hypothetical protein HZA93_26850 [Verrucomicrobia bacterium]|nr:hypothetical protein [Verrucomicrobiota bacterium]